MPVKQQLTKTTPAPITEPPDTQIERGLRTFCNDLDTARQLWQRYPHLIEAADFPEPFLSAYLENN
jgi:hypothetical protein